MRDRIDAHRIADEEVSGILAGLHDSLVAVPDPQAARPDRARQLPLPHRGPKPPPGNSQAVRLRLDPPRAPRPARAMPRSIILAKIAARLPAAGAVLVA
jgi:hypothetical protein